MKCCCLLEVLTKLRMTDHKLLGSTNLTQHLWVQCRSSLQQSAMQQTEMLKTFGILYLICWYGNGFLILMNVVFAHALASETGLVKIFCCACSWNIRHAHEPRRAVRYIKRMRMLGLMHLVRICLPFDPILVLKACQNTSSWPTVATSNDIWIYIILYIYVIYKLRVCDISYMTYFSCSAGLLAMAQVVPNSSQKDSSFVWQIAEGTGCWRTQNLWIHSFVRRCCWCLVLEAMFHQSCGACTGNIRQTLPSVCLCLVAYIVFAGHTIDCWPRLKLTQKQRDPRPLAAKTWRNSSWFVDPTWRGCLVVLGFMYLQAMEVWSSRRIHHTSPHPFESFRAVVKK